MVEQHAVTIRDIRIAYQVTGEPSAPPMVLLHALGERGSDWAPVTPAFAERHRVYAPDLRGHGDTDWPGDYSFRLMRDDVIGLLDVIGLRQVILVGHSMGAAVAYLVTIARPDLVARLVIEDASPAFPRDRPGHHQPGQPGRPRDLGSPEDDHRAHPDRRGRPGKPHPPRPARGGGLPHPYLPTDHHPGRPQHPHHRPR
jgi:pimeloyl-ACP methyl ester carboxylesterase